MKRTLFALLAVALLLAVSVVPCFADRTDTASGRWGIFRDAVDAIYDSDFTDLFASQMTYLENNESGYNNVKDVLVCLDLPHTNNRHFNVNYYSGLDPSSTANHMVFTYEAFTAINFGAIRAGQGDVLIGMSGRIMLTADHGLVYIYVYDDMDYNPEYDYIRLRYRNPYYVTSDGSATNLRTDHVVYQYDQCIISGSGEYTGMYSVDTQLIDIDDVAVAFLNRHNLIQQANNADVYVLSRLLGIYLNEEDGNGATMLNKWFDADQLWTGYTMGNEAGRNEGYDQGYNAGYAQGSNDGTAQTSLFEFIGAIFTAPATFITGILDFDLFGINVAGFVKVILTLSLVGAIIFVLWRLVR